ncbi:MAG: hypothetical protein ABI602_04350 [Candidatus Saccharibacteria bacterium]
MDPNINNLNPINNFTPHEEGSPLPAAGPTPVTPPLPADSAPIAPTVQPVFSPPTTADQPAPSFAPLSPSPTINRPAGEVSEMPPVVSPLPTFTDSAYSPAAGGAVFGDMSASAATVINSSQPTPGGASLPLTPVAPQGRKFPKVAIFSGTAVILLALGAAGYYFGYYQNPTVVYSQSLGNTGKAYSKLVDYANVASAVHFKGSVGDGTFKFKSGDTTTDGKLSFRGDGSSSDTKFDVGLGVTRVNVEVRTFKQAASPTPDSYIMASGIKGLGALTGSAALGTTLDGLDGKWIAVDHTLIDNLESKATQSSGTPTAPTKEQVIDGLRSFGAVNQQYVFSTKKDKAVTTVVKTYGVETIDGHKTIHYKVAFVKANVKQYIGAQKAALNASKLGAWIIKNKYQDSVNNSFTDLQKSADSIKSSDTIDVWADRGSRVVYKVRISDKTNSAANYIDLGLDHQKGASYPFFVTSHTTDGSTTNSGSLIATLDTATNAISLKANFKTTGLSASTIDANFTFKPSNDSVKIAVPTGAVNLSDVLNQLGLGDTVSALQASATSGVAGQAADSRRQADIRMLQTNAEAYNAEKGYYPSLAQFNNAAWRRANLPNLADSAMKDPDGTTGILSATPAAKVYAYQSNSASGGSCDGLASTTCTTFTLTATLSDGKLFTELNSI